MSFFFSKKYFYFKVIWYLEDYNYCNTKKFVICFLDYRKSFGFILGRLRKKLNFDFL